MAYKPSSSFLAVLLIFNVLLALAAHAVARRNTPESFKKQDMKQPQFFIDSDGSLNIPGIGRITVPPKYGLPPFGPFNSGSIGGGGTGSGGSYIPGGDDTFIPNPGYEIPNPGSGADLPPPPEPTQP
ncbi:Cell wall protein [Quillaja saponaria]|uniref:Cell wall protein n=1 Tax=Quillaja saponaria TaxID=32244 RepID=A0AAD7KYH4_QUISA|nr:Cell wall protein [Quillaja saponaria]